MTRRLEELLCFLTLLLGLATTMAQEAPSQDQKAGPASPTPQATGSAPEGGVSEQQMANATNPLAEMNSLQLQNYYWPTLYGVPNASANSLNLRGVLVSGRQIIRATLPISTAPTGASTIDIPGGGSIPDVSLPIGPITYVSGLGDLNVFDSIRLNSVNAPTLFALGPMLTAPTATNRALGNGKWQAGIAGIVVHFLPRGSLLAALATWQHSFAGVSDRPDTQVSTLQPIGVFQIGGGNYIRSSAIFLFDIKNDRYLIPYGLGVGRVIRVGNAVANAWIEPQFSVYHNSPGLPSFQLFTGINFQWAKKQ
jgi:hypothetical protein